MARVGPGLVKFGHVNGFKWTGLQFMTNQFVITSEPRLIVAQRGTILVTPGVTNLYTSLHS
jgi:hypothetical protein